MTHYTPQRKAEILDAIARGRVTEAEAMAEHQISAEELAEWRERMKLGIKGLYVTRKR